MLEKTQFIVEVRIEGYERFVVLAEDQADAEERAINCVQSGLPHAMKGRKLTVARIEKVKTADVLTLVGPAQMPTDSAQALADRAFGGE